MADFSPKLQGSMAQIGGRHYRGRPLHAPGPWNCPACDTPQTGPLEAGCMNPECGAGRPELNRMVNTQRGRSASQPSSPRLPQQPLRSGLSVAEQRTLRRNAVAFDVEALAARILGGMDLLLQERLGGGFSPAERHTICEALDLLASMFENEELTPPTGVLAAPGIRHLIDRLTADNAGDAPLAGDTFDEPESQPAAPQASRRPEGGSPPEPELDGLGQLAAEPDGEPESEPEPEPEG